MPTAKPTRHKEVERKFDVTESTVAPSFDGLAAVTRVELSPAASLDAVYYDTAAHDLAAHKITLRRRTGGSDEGWHLKLPAGPDARTEVRLPLGDADERVPSDLLDIVLAIVRDRPVSPVARITTTRYIHLLYGAAGTALAEFCDDQVTAWAAGGDELAWREWELEMLTADPELGLLDRLANRLLDAGATAAGRGSKLAKVLATGGESPARPVVADDLVHRAVAEQVSELIEWDRAVRADVWDSVHQMRVTTRKLRSLLKESEESFGLTDDSWVLDELKALAGILGVARDAEVLAERYEISLGELPAVLVRGPVRERLIAGAKKRYAVGHRRALSAMRTARYFRLLETLEGLASAEPVAAGEGSEHAPVTVDSAYKRVRKAAKAADQATEDRDEALHRIRKSAKRLRYTASALGADKVSTAAKEIQTLLGEHQDSYVSRAHLLEQADDAHAAGEDTFTYGLLYQHEHELADDARAQVEAALDNLDRSVRKL